MIRHRIKQNSNKTKFVIQEEKATWASRFFHFFLSQYPLCFVWKDVEIDYGCCLCYAGFSEAFEVLQRFRQEEIDKDAATWMIPDE